MQTRTNHRTRIILILAALVAGLGIVQPGTAQAAGPCKVVGYTTNATKEMQARGITKTDVVNAVRINCANGMRQGNGTWIYAGSFFQLPRRPVIVMSGSGWVQSAWWAGGVGGGGIGSWGVEPITR